MIGATNVVDWRVRVPRIVRDVDACVVLRTPARQSLTAPPMSVVIEVKQDSVFGTGELQKPSA